MSPRPEWDREGLDWPNREASRFVETPGMRWHVQIAGTGPTILLLHGTGAGTHSWRDLFPLLTPDFRVIAPDLPGHAFTSMPDDGAQTLEAMANGVDALMRELSETPVLIVGHSAGAAIAAQMCLDGSVSTKSLISLNGALLPLGGLQGHLFSPAARLLAAWSFIPRMVARHAADERVMAKFLDDTGSRIDARGASYYGRLAQCESHVAGVLRMMAQWDLTHLERDLPGLDARLVLVAASNDKTVSPSYSERVARLVPGAMLVSVPGLGHLSHEERPGETAALIRRELEEIAS